MKTEEKTDEKIIKNRGENNVYVSVATVSFHITARPDEESFIRKAEIEVEKLIKKYRAEGERELTKMLARAAIDGVVQGLKGEAYVNEAQTLIENQFSTIRGRIDEMLNSIK